MVDLLADRSQNNSYVKHVMGMYLYATGAARQTTSILSKLGVSSSYGTLAGTGARHLRVSDRGDDNAENSPPVTLASAVFDSEDEDEDWEP